MALELRRFGYPLITSIVLLALFCGLTGSAASAAGLLVAAAAVFGVIRVTRGAHMQVARRRGLACGYASRAGSRG
jgi:hypothetical protein